MRPSQYIIRISVFLVVALDPSGGGVGILIGVLLGAAIGTIATGSNMLKERRKTNTDNENE